MLNRQEMTGDWRGLRAKGAGDELPGEIAEPFGSSVKACRGPVHYWTEVSVLVQQHSAGRKSSQAASRTRRSRCPPQPHIEEELVLRFVCTTARLAGHRDFQVKCDCGLAVARWEAMCNSRGKLSFLCETEREKYENGRTDPVGVHDCTTLYYTTTTVPPVRSVSRICSRLAATCCNERCREGCRAALLSRTEETRGHRESVCSCALNKMHMSACFSAFCP